MGNTKWQVSQFDRVSGGGDDFLISHCDDVEGKNNFSLTAEGRVKARSFSDEWGNILPQGVIVMWGGEENQIPSGWALCNGNNGTPDLRDRFIVGAGSDAPHKTFGGPDVHSHKVTLPADALTVNEAGAHQHDIPAEWRSEGRNEAWVGSGHLTLDPSRKWGNDNERPKIGEGGAHSHTVTLRTASFDSDKNEINPKEINRPKYFSLCFIMKK